MELSVLAFISKLTNASTFIVCGKLDKVEASISMETTPGMTRLVCAVKTAVKAFILIRVAKSTITVCGVEAKITDNNEIISSTVTFNVCEELTKVEANIPMEIAPGIVRLLCDTEASVIANSEMILSTATFIVCGELTKVTRFINKEISPGITDNI